MEEDTTDDGEPAWTRVALIAGCILAAVTAALLVPSLASEGIAGSPIDSVLPGERFDNGEGAGDGGDGSGFGALNPGESTGVGGETGFDKDTFGNNDTELHFTVDSSASAYWRTGTYGTYTGTGWERDVERTPYEEPVDPGELAGERIIYEVEFERSASALPTAWRPTSVSGLSGLEITETGSFVSDRLLDPGTSYTAISRQPVRDVEVLRAAGQEYPSAIEQRYTQLPSDTPGRIGTLTDELTDDDETVYDAATTIQNWLRSEKGYSLQASQQSDTMADTFIFEMEEGYCEYFATAMTTMLRTQGIPARYTVGYTTGQKVDETTYEVRGMNAHAWVEVYFPDVGWVRFDPTPGGSRLEAQQEVLESESPDVEYDPTEEGSPGEVFEPGQVTTESNGSDDGNGTDGGDGYYDVSLNRTAVPGFAVEVTVTHEGAPVEGQTVLFNGAPVGVTGTDGTVVAMVPETDELRIAIRRPTGINATGDRVSQPDPVTAPPGGGGSVPADGGGSVASAGVAPTDWALDAAGQPEEENVTVVGVETDATVSVSGDPLPGSEVTAVATVEDVTVSDAAVYLNGEQVGRTDGNGQVTVRLPQDAGNSTLVVERGPIFGETELRIPSVDLDVDTGLVALPFTDATVEVTADGEGVADVPVAVDGSEVARTGPDGTAAVGLPLAASATITTGLEGPGMEVTVEGLLRNALLLLLGGGLAIGIPVGVAYRRGYRPRDLGSALLALAGRGRRALGRLAAALRGALGRVSRTLLYLAEFATGRESMASLQLAFAAWVRDRARQLGERLPGTEAEAPAELAESPGPPPDAPTVREAWDRFLAVLDLPEPEKQTPGELATHGVEEAQLPPEPVKTLRDAFREVEYGDRSPADRNEQLLAAIERIESSAAAGNGADEAVDTDAAAAGGFNLGGAGASPGAADGREQ